MKLFWFKLKVKLRLGNRFVGVGIGPIVIVANTKLQEMAIREGIIKKDMDLLFSISYYWSSRWIGMLYGIRKSYHLVRDRMRALGSRYRQKNAT